MAEKRTRSQKYTGVYWRYSAAKTHNGKPDKAFDYCYQCGGKLKWETAGWLSEGVSEQYAAQLRTQAVAKFSSSAPPLDSVERLTPDIRNAFELVKKRQAPTEGGRQEYVSPPLKIAQDRIRRLEAENMR